jgi:DNA-directed RNA polymerase subunit RPC12/RpoP
MGEMPWTIHIIWNKDAAYDIDMKNEEDIVAYHCNDCSKHFFLEDVVEEPYCPYCGSVAFVVMEIWYT